VRDGTSIANGDREHAGINYVFTLGVPLLNSREFIASKRLQNIKISFISHLCDGEA
jgi:hypothetical protein